MSEYQYYRFDCLDRHLGSKEHQALREIYTQRKHCWQQAQEQANRTCASGYDQASRYLHQLREAYQFKDDVPAFELRFQ